MKTKKIDHRTVYLLIWLRSLAIFMQLFTLLVANIWLQIILPLAVFFSIIFAYFIFHLFVIYHYKVQQRSLQQTSLFIHLCIDVFTLACLLYFSGGATNPLISLMLFPLTLTATLLSIAHTWFMAMIVITSYSFLMQFHISLPHNHASGNEFSLHVFGMWFGFILSASLVSFFIASIRKTLQTKEDLLHQASEQALKDKQILSLATLSASTAHELGTPLGTISLLSEELALEISDKTINKELIQPLKQQVIQCKEVLSTLSATTGNIHLDGGKKRNIVEFSCYILDYWQQLNPSCPISFSHKESTDSPAILAETLLEQAIINVLDNAWRESQKGIEIYLDWQDRTICLTIKDSGPGLDEQLLQTIGKQPFQNSQDGMGLGLFLSYTIIERLGGQIQLSNRQSGGLSTKLFLPVIL